jgi:hypothetical protein
MVVLNAMGMIVLGFWVLGLWGMYRDYRSTKNRYWKSGRYLYWDRVIRESRSEYDANRHLQS